MLPRFLVSRGWVTAIAAVLVACGPNNNGFDSNNIDATIDQPDTHVEIDTGPDVGPLGRRCTTNMQCDDGIECTDDLCGTDNRCVNVPNSGRCDNGVYCDGPERCDQRRGCVRGDPVSCDDNVVCTQDRCVEDTHTCEHQPLDRDGDGDPDDHCSDPSCPDGGVPDGSACWQGHDCNDADPRVNSRVPEICSDMIDNNCNGFVDSAEPGGCVRAPHDRCDDPLDVTAGGVFSLDMAAAQPDYSIRCAGGVAHDMVAVLHLTSPHDLDITGDSPSNVVAVALQTVCGSTTGSDTLECDYGFPGRVRRHSVPAGDYFIIIGTSGTDPVDLTVRITDPTPQPPNDTCATALVIPGTGGTYRSDLIGAHDDVSTSCGGSGRDLIYTFTLPTASDVTLQLAGGRTDYLSLSLASNCTAAPTVLRCDSGSTVSFTAHQLVAGTYYVIVESYDPIYFTLQANFGPPTPPPMGDTCSNPLPLVVGTPVSVSSGTFENDYRLSCATTGRDTVFRFSLTTRSDVLIDTTSSSSIYFGVAVGAACPPASGSVCNTGTSPRTFAMGLDPGTYYAIVKPSRDTDYQVQMTAFPPLAVTPVTGNDNCTSASMIPAGRSYFSGNTSTLTDDYNSTCAGSTRGKDAVFSFHLDTTERVTFVTETSFFHVVWIAQGPGCPGTRPASAVGNTCTLGTHTTLDATLGPGDYYFFVDGLSSGYEGTYSVLALVGGT